MIWDRFINTTSVVRRKFTRTKGIPINLIKEGDYVKISGIAQDNGNLLRAPFSGEMCLCYSILVEEKGNAIFGRVLKEQVRGYDFFVKDFTAKVWIRASIGTPYLINSYVGESGFLKNPDKHVVSYLKKFNLSTTDIWGMNKKLCITEGIIRPGDQLAVVGFVGFGKPFPDSEENELIMKRGERELYLSNIPNWVREERS